MRLRQNLKRAVAIMASVSMILANTGISTLAETNNLWEEEFNEAEQFDEEELIADGILEEEPLEGELLPEDSIEEETVQDELIDGDLIEDDFLPDEDPDSVLEEDGIPEESLLVQANVNMERASRAPAAEQDTEVKPTVDTDWAAYDLVWTMKNGKPTGEIVWQEPENADQATGIIVKLKRYNEEACEEPEDTIEYTVLENVLDLGEGISQKDRFYTFTVIYTYGEDSSEEEYESNESAAVYASAGITQQPKDVYVEAGTPVRYSVFCEGAVNYEWSYSEDQGETWIRCAWGKNLSAIDNIETVSEMNGRLYRCTVTDRGGYQYVSESAELTIGSLASTDVLMKQDGTVTWSNPVFQGSGMTWDSRAVSVLYYKTMSDAVSEVNGNEKYLIPAQYSDTSTQFNLQHGLYYRAYVIDIYNEVEPFIKVSDISNVIFIRGDITAHPDDVTTDKGGSAAFSAAYSVADAAYQWQYSSNGTSDWTDVSDTDGSISGATTGTLSLSDVQVGGYYRCVFTDSEGDLYSDSAQLTIRLEHDKPYDLKWDGTTATWKDLEVVPEALAQQGYEFNYYRIEVKKASSSSADWENAETFYEDDYTSGNSYSTSLDAPAYYAFRVAARFVNEDYEIVQGDYSEWSKTLYTSYHTEPYNLRWNDDGSVSWSAPTDLKDSWPQYHVYIYEYASSQEASSASLPDDLSGYYAETLEDTGELTTGSYLPRLQEGKYYRFAVVGSYYDYQAGADRKLVSKLSSVYHAERTPLAFVNAPKTVSAEVGDEITFTAEVTGKGLHYYYSYFDETTQDWMDIGFDDTRTTPSFTTEVVESSDVGLYYGTYAYIGTKYRLIVTDMFTESSSYEDDGAADKLVVYFSIVSKAATSIEAADEQYMGFGKGWNVFFTVEPAETSDPITVTSADTSKIIVGDISKVRKDTGLSCSVSLEGIASGWCELTVTAGSITKIIDVLVEPMTYKVTFDAGEGTFQDGSKVKSATLHDDQKYGDASVFDQIPVRAGYYFSGWFRNANNSVHRDDYVSSSSPRELFALWSPSGSTSFTTRTVTYRADDAILYDATDGTYKNELSVKVVYNSYEPTYYPTLTVMKSPYAVAGTESYKDYTFTADYTVLNPSGVWENEATYTITTFGTAEVKADTVVNVIKPAIYTITLDPGKYGTIDEQYSHLRVKARNTYNGNTAGYELPTFSLDRRVIFDGWYAGDTKVNPAKDKPTADTTLTARWITSDVYKVTFTDDDGTELSHVWVDGRKTSTRVTVPFEAEVPKDVRIGGMIPICYVEGEGYDIQLGQITADTTYVVSTRAPYTVTFIADEAVLYDAGNDTYKKQIEITLGKRGDGYPSIELKCPENGTVRDLKRYSFADDQGNALEISSAYKSDSGKTFIITGFKDAPQINCSTTVHITSAQVYTVTLDTDEIWPLEEKYQKLRVIAGEKLSENIAEYSFQTPIGDDYNVLDGWYSGSTKIDPESFVPTGDITLTARWLVLNGFIVTENVTITEVQEEPYELSYPASKDGSTPLTAADGVTYAWQVKNGDAWEEVDASVYSGYTLSIDTTIAGTFRYRCIATYEDGTVCESLPVNVTVKEDSNVEKIILSDVSEGGEQNYLFRDGHTSADVALKADVTNISRSAQISYRWYQQKDGGSWSYKADTDKPEWNTVIRKVGVYKFKVVADGVTSNEVTVTTKNYTLTVADTLITGPNDVTVSDDGDLGKTPVEVKLTDKSAIGKFEWQVQKPGSDVWFNVNDLIGSGSYEANILEANAGERLYAIGAEWNGCKVRCIVTIGDTIVCSREALITLTSEPEPQPVSDGLSWRITKQSKESYTVRAGEEVFLYVYTEGTDKKASFYLYKDGEVLVEKKNSSYFDISLGEVTPKDEGIYTITVSVTDPETGVTTSRDVKTELHVTDDFAFTAQTLEAYSAIKEVGGTGNDVTFFVTTKVYAEKEQNQDVTYQWYRKGTADTDYTALNGETEKALTVTGITSANDKERYQCIATYHNKKYMSKPAELKVAYFKSDDGYGTKDNPKLIYVGANNDRTITCPESTYTPYRIYKQLDTDNTAEEGNQFTINDSLSVAVIRFSARFFGSADYCSDYYYKVMVLDFILQPENQYVDAGESATFTVQGNLEGVTYQWYEALSDTPIEGANQASFTTGPVTPENESKMYFCEISYGGATMQSNIVSAHTGREMEVEDLADQTISMVPEMAGQTSLTATFQVESNLADSTYQWFKGTIEGTHEELPGETGSTLSIIIPCNAADYEKSLADYNGNTYYCVVRNGQQAIATNPAKLNLLYYTMPEDWAADRPTYFVPDKPLTLTVQSTVENSTYQWYKTVNNEADNLNLIEGATSGSYTFTPADTDAGTEYSVQITAPDGKTRVWSGTFTLETETEFSGSVAWRDNNAFGDRPAKVTVKLHASYVEGGETVTLADDAVKVLSTSLANGLTKELTSSNVDAEDPNTWNVLWNNLPETVPGSSNKLTYWMTEENVPTGYTQSSNADQTVITNTQSVTKVTVQVMWSGEVFGFHADSVEYLLQRKLSADMNSEWDYVRTTDTEDHPVVISLAHAEPTSGGGDTGESYGTFTDLPIYNSEGEAYVYRAVAASINNGAAYVEWKDDSSMDRGYVGGYQVSLTDYTANEDGFTVEGDLTLWQGGILVKVIFDDDNNRDQIRPESVSLSLSSEPAVDLTNNNPMIINGTDLYKGEYWQKNWISPIRTAEGTAIIYTISVDDIPGYTASFSPMHGETVSADGKVDLTGELDEFGEAWVKVTLTHIPDASLAVYSRTDSSSASVANLTVSEPIRGAKYEAGSSVTVTAPDKSSDGYNFLGWYKVTEASDGEATAYDDSAPVSKLLKYTFTINDDTALVAVYKASGYANVVIISQNGAKYTVNDSTTVQQGSTESVQIGKTLSLKAHEPDKVLQWENESGKILGKGSSLTLTIVGQITVKLVYKAASQEQIYVQFLTDYGQVLSYKSITERDPVIYPTEPTKYGYTFDKWVFEGTAQAATEEAIKAKIADERLVTIVPKYSKNAETFNVQINYVTGEADAAEAISDPLTYEKLPSGKSYRFAAQEIEGYTFDHWEDEQGSVLGYNAEYYLTISKDIILYARYVESGIEVKAQPVIMIGDLYTVVSGDVHKVSGAVTRSIPEGYSLIEQGLLYAKDVAGLTEETFVEGVTGVKKYISSNTSMDGVTTLNVKVLEDDIVVSLRGYMKLKDTSTGEMKIFYTEVREGSYAAISR